MDQQQVENMIESAIERAMDNLEVKIRIDRDGDLEVTLFSDGHEISQDYVKTDNTYQLGDST